MNNEIAHHRIIEIFSASHVDFTLIHHPPCRTSEESATARGGAGFPEAVGAKALIVKSEFADGFRYSTLVLPAHLRLDGKVVKTNIRGLKRFRFLTTEEMLDAVQLSPGCMPPFGPTVFPAVSDLFVDPKLQEFETIGFNVAHAERSLVVSTRDYLRVAMPTTLVSLSADEQSVLQVKLAGTVG